MRPELSRGGCRISLPKSGLIISAKIIVERKERKDLGAVRRRSHATTPPISSIAETEDALLRRALFRGFHRSPRPDLGTAGAELLCRGRVVSPAGREVRQFEAHFAPFRV